MKSDNSCPQTFTGTGGQGSAHFGYRSVLCAGTTGMDGDSFGVKGVRDLMFRERRLAYRTIEGWVRSVLLEVGTIRECEEHGWMQDRTDPHAHHRAIEIAREMPPPGVSLEAAAIAVAEVLDGIGDTCPECCRKTGTDDGLFGSDSA